MAVKHCSSSREGKVLLSCWIPQDLRTELDRVWVRPWGRSPLAAQQES
jgi:hypothetical protein